MLWICLLFPLIPCGLHSFPRELSISHFLKVICIGSPTPSQLFTNLITAFASFDNLFSGFSLNGHLFTYIVYKMGSSHTFTLYFLYLYWVLTMASTSSVFPLWSGGLHLISCLEMENTVQRLEPNAISIQVRELFWCFSFVTVQLF